MSTVGGSAQRRDSTARALTELLPTAEEVSAAVGNPLDAAGPPKVGSIDVLPNGIRDSDAASPLDCLGAIMPLMRVVYESGGVQAAALQDYARFGEGLTVSSAEAGVVRLGSDDAAARTFAAFATRWQVCDGTTVSLHLGGGAGGVGTKVTDVRVDGPILSATIINADGTDTFPTEHAVGVAGDCIVDVDVAVTDPYPPNRVATTRAVDIVKAMIGKIRLGR